MVITMKRTMAILLAALTLCGLVMQILKTDAHAEDTVVRGDITFVRVKENSFERIPNDAFKLTNNATGEYHILVTDANGQCSTAESWHSHGDDTNGNDTAYDADANEMTGTFSGPTGIWFSQEDAGIAAVGTAGALPAGTYTLEEIECPANRGLELISGIQIAISGTGTVDLGALTARTITLDGDAVDLDTDLKKAFARNPLTIKDMVDYDGVVQGETYRLTGKLIDKATGNPLEEGGEEVIATKEFTASGARGNVKLDFTLDAAALEGTDIVVFTYLYKDDLLLAAHEELEDASQTVEILKPTLTSEAVNPETGNHMAAAKEDVSITDTIQFSQLIGGNRYTLTTALLDEDGDTIAEESQIIHPNLPRGTVTETITFDAAGYEGKTVIMTQTLTWDGMVIAVHDDLSDVKQQIRFPAITTSVTDDRSKDRVALAADGARITDTVTYQNVYEGTQIKLTGTLMDRDTGKVFEREGKPVTAEVIFTPDKRDGTQDVSFEFDGPDLKNKTLVVYEELYTGTHCLTEHKDLNDEKQTVRFPGIDAVAVDSETKEQISAADDSVTINDKVQYSNVLPHREYTLTGMLYDAETNSPLEIDGQQITAEETFTANKPSGSKTLSFTFDAHGLEGRKVAVYEYLKLGDVMIALQEEQKDAVQMATPAQMRSGRTGIKANDFNATDQTADLRDFVVDTGGHIPAYIIMGCIMLMTALGILVVMRVLNMCNR